MKKFLYTTIAMIIVPFALIGIITYGILHVIQLLCHTIKEYIRKGMRWVDKNITPNIG